jgi:hypothetical protein
LVRMSEAATSNANMVNGSSLNSGADWVVVIVAEFEVDREVSEDVDDAVDV